MADIGLNDDGHLADLLRVHSPEHMPFARDADELRDWWNGRAIPLGRDGLRTSLGRLGIGDPRALLAGSRALSLCDHYWIRTDPRERWGDVNPYSVCEDFIDGSTELVTASRILSGVSGDNLDSYRDRFVSICMENGIDISEHMARMTLIDHVMMSTDRHLGNYGLIRDADTLEWLGPAPIYDTGTSLMCRSSTERIDGMLR